MYGVLFQAEKQDIVHHDGETMTIRSALTQTNSYIHILTCMLIDEMPDIDSDLMNFLLVSWTKAFLVREKTASTSRCICATHTTFVGVSSWVLSLVDREKGD